MRVNTTTLLASALAFFALASAGAPADETAQLTSIFGGDAEATQTAAPEHGKHSTPRWMKTVAPSKLSVYASDMASLRSSIHSNSLYPSMTSVMATAIPERYKQLLEDDPESAKRQFEGTHKPHWYEAIPTDIRSFMDANAEARQSVLSKDIGEGREEDGARSTATANAGPKETGATATATAASGDHKNVKIGSGDGKTSEAPDSVRVAGAAIGTVLGAIAVAALLM